uniref:Uncharacterized protein n=1 Tax=Candidatus Kentrum sp. SD TaxID=2126332 RepID=A0A450YV65_9GAMM|nr:MAG: hypothetical protein BECKSD772F_GA0070984_10533 [Candidatus Kentron sp. SD]VFK45402.1 MAG: hypothetical protein BECKSD772E_GA0070983_10533 [Candidatus Kentron sp. SD]
MNTTKLHTIAKALNSEMTGSDVVSIISQVMQSLQRQVNQPHPDHQEKLSGNLSNLYKKLEGSPVDDFSLLWRNAMEELGVADKFGSRLEKKNNAAEDGCATPG